MVHRHWNTSYEIIETGVFSRLVLARQMTLLPPQVQIGRSQTIDTRRHYT
ncbi:MAG TPA: hypothetical protein VLH40_00240 [Atribacteraceae bacterium]|nr:hypothetical protein [Atribacteraceae bacterium]